MGPNRMSTMGLALALILTVYVSEINGAANLLGRPHIIGGVNVNIEEVPYQISLESLRMHVCGGVIISEKHALTAAHCVTSEQGSPEWTLRIRAGSSTQIPIVGFTGTIHQIEKVRVHFRYNKATIDYDMAVLFLSNPFEFGSRVQPIQVPIERESDFIDYSQNVTVTGWGLTKINGWFLPMRLQKVDFPLLPREECEYTVGEYNRFTNRMLCGAANGVTDTNSGDSGGPVVHKKKLIGLVSYGLRTNNPTLPSVYANLLQAEMRNFIKRETGV